MDITELKEKVSRTSLYIGRIPENTKTEFVELAKTEFASDYGMTMKWLLDFRKGLLENPNSALSDRIDVLVEEVNQLKKSDKKEPEQEKRKMLSGRELKRRNEK
ncbi:MAG: hypothetical protein CL811_06645 [Colwelliaceae bacterium]|jgi:hypothetical protein|nr:hypothetical protein [Colwelliaceae bacterium]|tara:strand:+ start:290 stop:601 length:312 start_codon:yes stop_codon:yes gene_type:complete